MICENCGKEHDGSYGSGRFCCKKCARSFSTKNKKHIKICKCECCGKEFKLPLNSSRKICDDCLGPKRVKCVICGRDREIGKHCENEFCQKHSTRQISSLIKYFGFDKRKLGTLEVESEFLRVRELLYNLYWNEHKSAYEIEKMFNYPIGSNLVGKIFNYLEIPHKEDGYAVKEKILYGNSKLPNNKGTYKAEWHTSWNGKEVYLRSSYEKDYANELDNLQIDYEVESLRIKYYDTAAKDYKCAIPDFYIPEQNMIVEIKSTYTLDVQNMKDKVKEYKNLGYNVKLIVDHTDKTYIVE